MTRIHHLALRTPDPGRLARFYEDVFELTRDRDAYDARGLRSVWLRAEGTLVMLERREPGEPEPDPRSMECVLFSIDEARVPALHERLRTRGVAIEGQTRFSTYFRDPEGRRVGASCFSG